MRDRCYDFIQNKKNVLVSIVIALCAIFLVIFLICRNQNNEKIRLTAIYEYAQICAIIDIVKEQSLLEKYLPDNVEVEWQMIDSGSDRRDALATNRAAIAIIENTKVIPSIEQGYTISILGGGSITQRGIYTSNPDIKTPNDLIGKKIAHQGSSVIVTLKTDLKRNYDIEITDEQLLSVGEQELLNMIATNQVDVAILTGTMSEKITSMNPEVHEIYDLTPEVQRIGVSNWLVGSTQFFDEHPELLEPVMKAYTEALNEAKDNPKGVSEMLAPLFGISATQIEKELTMYPPELGIYGYDEMANILYENGDLKNPAKPFSELTNYDQIPKKAE